MPKGTPTKKYGPANCECDGVSHGCEGTVVDAVATLR